MDMAELRVTAVDQASAVLAKIKGSADDVSKSGENLKSVWNGGMMDGFTKGPALAAVGVIGALSAAAIGAGTYFVSLAKQVMESQAALKSMSEVTGASVEGLSAIRSIAKLTGIDMESVSGGLTKLAKNMSVGGAEVEKALKAIGLSLKDMQGLKTDEQFLKITAAMSGYADGAGKTAAAQLLLGKSGAQLLPLMKDISEAGDLVAKTTYEQALQADELEKNIKRLVITKEAWKKIIGAELVPVLGDIVIVMLNLQKQTGGLNETVKHLAEDGSIKRWAQDAAIGLATVVDVLKTTAEVFKVAYMAGDAFGAGMVAIGAKVASALAPMNTTLLQLANSTMDTFQKKASEAGIAFDKLMTGNHTGTVDALKTQFTESAAAAALASAHFAKFGDTVGAIRPKITGLTTDTADAKEKTNALGKALDELFNKLNNPGADAEFVKQQQLLTKALQVGAISLEKYWIAMHDAAVRSKTFNDINKEIADSLKINEELLGKNRDAVEAAMQAVKDSNLSMRDEIATMGMTKLGRDLYNLALKKTSDLRRIDATLSGEEHDMRVKELDDLYANAEAMLKQRDAIESQQSAWGSLSSATENFFADLFQNGTKAFGNLWNTIKQWFAQVAAKFATKFVLNAVFGGADASGLLGSVLGGGSSGGGLLGSILGNAGSSAAGGLLGTLGGVMGLGSGAGILGTVGAGAQLGLTGLASGTYGAAFGLAGGAGGAAGALGMLGAALPVLIPLAIVAGLAAYFSKDEKGIKFDNSLRNIAAPPANVQTAALGNFAPSGDVDAKTLSALQPFLNKVKGLDDYIATNLLSDKTLADVRERIQALQNPRWWNMDDKDAIEKASKYFLQQRYGAAFESINASVAATIQNFQGTADELLQFIDSYIQMRETVLAAQRAAKEAIESTSSDVAQILEDQSNSVLAAYRAQTRGIQGLLDLAPDTANALGTIVTGMAAFRSAAVQLLVQIENVRTAVGDMFGQTIRDLQLSLMTPEQQYAFLQNDANTLLAQALGSNDPQQIQALLTKLNQDITQAMGLLSPEQRALIAPDQITRLTEINDQVNARLNDLRDTTQADLATTLQSLSDKLDKVAEAQLAAAATQQTAADTNLAAAKTPVTVDLNLTIDGQPVGLTTTEA